MYLLKNYQNRAWLVYDGSLWLIMAFVVNDGLMMGNDAEWLSNL